MYSWLEPSIRTASRSENSVSDIVTHSDTKTIDYYNNMAVAVSRADDNVSDIKDSVILWVTPVI